MITIRSGTPEDEFFLKEMAYQAIYSPKGGGVIAAEGIGRAGNPALLCGLRQRRRLGIRGAIRWGSGQGSDPVAAACRRENAAAGLLPAALTSMLTGITEPLEFTFLFVATPLYIIHAALAGVAYMLMHLFSVGVGMAFSGGFIDMFLYGILQGNAETNWIWIVIIGLVYFVVYYFLFSFLIKKFNYKTPGREDDATEVKLYTRADMNAKAQEGAVDLSSVVKNETDEFSVSIIYGLGGAANIVDVDSCATRLRTTVADGNLVDEELLKGTGAAGVLRKG